MLRRLYISFHLLTLVPLLVLALPLALLAVATTALALLTLLARLIIVYLDLAVALLASWIPPLLPSSPTATRKHRRRQSSTAPSPRPLSLSIARPAAGGVATPSPQLSRRTSRSDSHASVVLGLGIAPDRDYEGVGGWRLVDDGLAGPAGPGAGSGSDDDGAGGEGAAGDEAALAGWNSRLELLSGGVPRRQRSFTGSSSSATAGALPQDRVRRVAGVPRPVSFEREDAAGYFGQTHGLERPSSGIVMTSLDDEMNQHVFSRS
jgi:hypothetical protein